MIPNPLKNYLAALKIYKKINDKQNIGVCYLTIGIIYYNQGNFTEALEKQFEALKKFEELKEKQEIPVRSCGGEWFSRISRGAQLRAQRTRVGK